MARPRMRLVALALVVAVSLLGEAEARSMGLTARQHAALTMAGFIRDSVESVPAHEVPGDGERGAHRSHMRSQIAPFGTRPLPLREAVEKSLSARDR